MSNDTFLDYSSPTSGCQRVVGAGCGMIVGIILIPVSFILLFWNEGRAVRTEKGLQEGAANVVEVGDPAQVNPAGEGKQVHLTGRADTEEVLADPEFGVSEKAIRLDRVVEMYQWVEQKEEHTEKKVGGGSQTVTKYTYTKAWAAGPVDSRQFAHPEGHQNPPGMRYPGASWVAREVRLGGYVLSAGLMSQLSGGESVPVSQALLDKMPDGVRQQLQVRGQSFYLPQNPGRTGEEVGDLRVSFHVIRPTTVSVLARQVKNSFDTYTSSNDVTVFRLMMGEHSAADMYERMQAENTAMTWILRFVGFLLMAFGIALCFQPIVAIADFIPFVGDMVGGGVALFAFATAFLLTLLTIAAGWITYRPLLSVFLLVGMGVSAYGLHRLTRGRGDDSGTGRKRRRKKRRRLDRQDEAPRERPAEAEGGLVVPRANKPPAPVTGVRPAPEAAPPGVPESPDAPMEIRCPNCDATYNVPVKVLGKKTHCKQCQTLFVIQRAVAPETAASPEESDPQLELVSEQEDAWTDTGRVAPRARAAEPPPPRKRRKRRSEGAGGSWASRNRVLVWILGLVVVPCVMLMLTCAGVIWSLIPSSNRASQDAEAAAAADTRPNLDPKDVTGLYLLDKNQQCRLVISPDGDIRVEDRGRIFNGSSEGEYTIHGHHLALNFGFAPTINDAAFGSKESVEIDGDRLIHPVVGTFIRQPSPWSTGGTKVPPLADVEGNGPMGTASLVVLGQMDGHPVRGLGLSPDGSTVVGETSVQAGGLKRPFHWTKQGGYVDMGWPEEQQFGCGAGRATSSDGSAVAGDSYLKPANTGEAVRFSLSGTHSLRPRKELHQGPGIHLNVFGSLHSSAYAISADGSVLAGYTVTPQGLQAFRWTQAGGLASLGTLVGPNNQSQSHAFGMSGDGKVVVGMFGALGVQQADAVRAFRWTAEGGIKQLTAGPEYKGFTPANAVAVSADGRVVVGQGHAADKPMTQVSYRWTEEAGAVPLDDLPGAGDYSTPLAVSGDGSVAAGLSVTGGRGERAALWEAKTGVHDLQAALARDYGLNLNEWKLATVRGVSADGRTLMGEAIAAGDLSRNAADSVRTWVVTLRPGGDALFAKETFKAKEYPKQTPGKASPPAAQLARGHEREIAIPDGFALNNANPLVFQISPNGQFVAAWGQGGVVKVWDINTGKELATYKPGQDEITGFAFTPDGRLLATFGTRPNQPDASSVKIWDWGASKEVASLEDDAPVEKALFSPDGKILATGDGNGKLKLWDVATWKAISTIELGAGVVHMAFSADGSVLAVAAGNVTIHVIDVPAKRVRSQFAGWRNLQWGFGFLVLSHDGKTVAMKGTSYSGDDMFFWDVATGALRASYRFSPRSEADTLAFAPDDKTVAVGSHDGGVGLWDLETGSQIAASDGHGGALYTRVTYLPDGKLLVASDKRSDGKQPRAFHLWIASLPADASAPGRGAADMPRPDAGGAVTKPAPAPKADVPAAKRPADIWSSEPLLLKGHAATAATLAFSADGKTLVTAGSDGEVKVWDVATGKEQAGLGKGSSEVFALAPSPDGKLLAVAGGDGARSNRRGTVKILETASGKEVARLEGHAGRVRCVVFTRDGKTLATGSFDGTVKLWDVGAAKELHNLAHPSERVASLAFSPDGSQVAVGCDSGNLQLWDVGSGAERRNLKGPAGNILALAYAPDGKTLAATNARESSITLWDMDGGDARGTLRGPVGKIASLSFSADGKVLATGGVDGSVRLWDCATAKVRTSTTREPGWTVSTIAPDGKLLTATADKDGTVKLWKVQLPAD